MAPRLDSAIVDIFASLNLSGGMIALTVQVPETVAAEYYDAADRLNREFGMNPPLDAKALMAFSLARHDAADLCGQFELLLRAVRGVPVPQLQNPVMK